VELAPNKGVKISGFFPKNDNISEGGGEVGTNMSLDPSSQNHYSIGRYREGRTNEKKAKGKKCFIQLHNKSLGKGVRTPSMYNLGRRNGGQRAKEV